ncbi:MAG: hypothetical protein Q4F07_07555 [Bacteroidales bacterium]|nr:hypothetical protein [Bacteroidales bacterium]
MGYKPQFKIYCSIVLSIAAIIVSIVAASRTLHEYLKVDILSLLVGIMAVLVTVLIGWQIFVLIDIKNYDSKFSKLEEQFNKSDFEIRGYSSLGYAHTNIAWLTKAKRGDWFIEYMRHSLLALSYFSKSGNVKTCWVIIDELIANIDNGDPEYYNIVKNNKQEWLLSLNDINCPDKISNFKDLIKLIYSF